MADLVKYPNRKLTLEELENAKFPAGQSYTEALKETRSTLTVPN